MNQVESRFAASLGAAGSIRRGGTMSASFDFVETTPDRAE